MKIAVIGACGKTGTLVCKEALARGYKVAGLARSDCGINDTNFNLIVGNALNLNDLEKTIKGADAVISVVGHVKLKEPYIQTEITKNIIKICKAQKINKIISLTGTGVRIANDKISLTDRFLNAGLSLVDNDRIDDGKLHALELKNSSLDYVLLRVLKLSNQKKLQKYKLTEHGPAKLLVSRIMVANILLDLAETNNWNRKSPIVS